MSVLCKGKIPYFMNLLELRVFYNSKGKMCLWSADCRFVDRGSTCPDFHEGDPRWIYEKEDVFKGKPPVMKGKMYLWSEDVFMKGKMYLWREDVFMKERCIYEGEDVFMKGKMCLWRGRCIYEGEDVFMKGRCIYERRRKKSWNFWRNWK